MQAVGLQTHIWANNTRSIVLLAMFPVLLVLVLYGLQLVLMGVGIIPGSGGTLADDMALAAGMLGWTVRAAGVFAADEHPILVTELGGTDGVFGEVVVEFDLPVHEAGFEVRPLAGGIGERLAQLAFGRDPAKAGEPPD